MAGGEALQSGLQAGIRHFVFSALEDTRPYLKDDDSYPAQCEFQGQPSKVPFYDAKGAIKVCKLWQHSICSAWSIMPQGIVMTT